MLCNWKKHIVLGVGEQVEKILFFLIVCAKSLVATRPLSRHVSGLMVIIERIKFGLQGERFNSLSNDNFLFSLFEYSFSIWI